ncbi:hypothetical protein Pint_18454 [Pistacia integerrima]|uniref:Uncharacterized protein n=1 Tax=Pistacia integerrima TaxID=434235 RepID=A0ACC0Z073_9ROSI|nr:hypothetical protein Pint_18454 [Pistacia integerrima]
MELVPLLEEDDKVSACQKKTTKLLEEDDEAAGAGRRQRRSGIVIGKSTMYLHGCKMEPQLFNLKFQLFDIDCEIRNVDPDEFSYIVLIKDMKKCVTKENEVVDFILAKFRVEARLSLSRKKRLIDNEEDVAFLFEQYGSKRLKDIRLYVNALLVEFVESLQPLPEPNPNKPNDTQTEISKSIQRMTSIGVMPPMMMKAVMSFFGIVRNVDGEVDDNDGGSRGRGRGLKPGDNGEKERVGSGDDKGEEGG